MHRDLFFILLSLCTTLALAFGCGSTTKGTHIHTQKCVVQHETTQSSVSTAHADAHTRTKILTTLPKEKKVSFKSLGSTLEGMLSMPTQNSNTPHSKKHPAILLIHDLGPIDADAHIQGSLGIALPTQIPIFAQLAQHLTQRGFVVLRYTKRTCTSAVNRRCKSAARNHAPKDQATTLVHDAKEALYFLAQHERVNPAKLGVVAHGHGMEIALSITSSSTPPRAIVGWAPSTHSIQELITHQTSWSLQYIKKKIPSLGDTAQADLARQQIAQLQRSLKAQREGFARLDKGLLSEPILGLSVQTWRGYSKLHKEAFSHLRTTQTPILALFGTLDASLLPNTVQTFSHHIDANKTLKEKRVLILDDTTHNMIELDQNNQAPPELSTRALEETAAFLHLHLGSKKKH